MNTRVTRLFASAALVLSVLLLPGAAGAQHFAADEDLELMLRYIVEDGAAPGVVLGVLEADGSMRVVAYGSSGPGARPLGPRSVFEIGSVTKTLTGALLAEMAARGEVALDDPVSKYLPEHVSIPSRGGREITLEHLATHMSALPRLPTNYRPADMRDPYASFTVEMLHDFLSNHQLRGVPGTGHLYSNVGYGLLGYALSRAAGTSYGDLLRERILEPLGMEMTYVPDPETRAEGEWTVRGHREGVVVPHWYATEAIHGAGTVRSNAADLLRFLKANVGPPATDLERAFRTATDVRVPDTREGRDGSGQGLAWRTIVTPQGGVLTWHGGATGGFQANVAFAPDRRIGTVLLANDNAFRDAIGNALLYHEPPPADWVRVPVAPDVLARYTGEYEVEDVEHRYYIRLEDEGYLTYQRTGLVRARLYATSDSTFHLLRGPWTFTFLETEDGAGFAMVMEEDERSWNPGAGGRIARKVRDEMPPPAAVAGYEQAATAPGEDEKERRRGMLGLMAAVAAGAVFAVRSSRRKRSSRSRS